MESSKKFNPIANSGWGKFAEAIPEPATLPVVGLALGGALAWSRKRATNA
jgi:PEP-CTERM motif